MSNTEKALLGVIDLVEAKRLKSLFESRGIRLELVGNPETCKAGSCKPTVEVYVELQDAQKVVEHLRSERSVLMADLNANADLHDQTFDPGQDKAVCPACGTEFSTTNKECPDCGLVFVLEEA